MKLQLPANYRTSRWTKNGHDRLYVKFNGQDLGYIDMNTRMEHLRRTGKGRHEAAEILGAINEWLASGSTEIESADNSRTFNAGNGFYGSAADNARGYDGIE